MLNGDGMGVGKTLQGILVMWLVKDDPGMSIVVAPANLCPQWVAEIEGAFEEVGPNRYWRLTPADSLYRAMVYAPSSFRTPLSLPTNYWREGLTC